ncbi:hypothetical protein E2C01_029956 [Portunus trituberculatus]|uniref:Uncharacterized protein n=1 Tax=Portunus trituberculatus TaxID=210409 RepID=A0A5B7ETL2_PORTR|nr:hypothetical protein [Portunus trituberculatus]
MKKFRDTHQQSEEDKSVQAGGAAKSLIEAATQTTPDLHADYWRRVHPGSGYGGGSVGGE